MDLKAAMQSVPVGNIPTTEPELFEPRDDNYVDYLVYVEESTATEEATDNRAELDDFDPDEFDYDEDRSFYDEDEDFYSDPYEHLYRDDEFDYEDVFTSWDFIDYDEPAEDDAESIWRQYERERRASWSELSEETVTGQPNDEFPMPDNGLWMQNQARKNARAKRRANTKRRQNRRHRLVFTLRGDYTGNKWQTYNLSIQDKSTDDRLEVEYRRRMELRWQVRMAARDLW